jgi:hypothetical protein
MGSSIMTIEQVIEDAVKGAIDPLVTKVESLERIILKSGKSKTDTETPSARMDMKQTAKRYGFSYHKLYARATKENPSVPVRYDLANDGEMYFLTAEVDEHILTGKFPSTYKQEIAA